MDFSTGSNEATATVQIGEDGSLGWVIAVERRLVGISRCILERKSAKAGVGFEYGMMKKGKLVDKKNSSQVPKMSKWEEKQAMGRRLAI